MENRKREQTTCHAELVSASIHSETEQNLCKPTNVKTLTRHPEGETRRISSRSFRRFFALQARLRMTGFTLAEVLITIAIIGVVAAMTIPTLVQNYEERSWNTAASNFERKLGEALKVMASQQSLACLGDTETFVNELSKNMQTSKICDKDHLSDCFSESFIAGTSAIDIATGQSVSDNEVVKVSDISVADFGHGDWNVDLMGIKFLNGVSAIVAYNPICSAGMFSNSTNMVTFSGDKNNLKLGTDLISMVYDTSGEVKPNLLTKDIRSINASIADGCKVKKDGTCMSEFFTPTAVTKTECQSMIGNGVVACYYDADYWAGAVKYCQNKGMRLPSQAEWRVMAQYLYGSGSQNSNLSGTITYNTDRAAKINAPTSPFTVWSNVEEREAGVHISVSIFGASKFSTFQNAGYTRNNSGLRAACIGG